MAAILIPIVLFYSSFLSLFCLSRSPFCPYFWSFLFLTCTVILFTLRLDTDVLFASSSGLKSLLVLTGFSSLDEVKQKKQSKSPTDQQQVPDYYLASLADLNKLLTEM